ncbi:hypothetical protein TWF281_004238 [Arthrobotrys megalospora]
MAFALTTRDFALQEDTLLVAQIRKDKDTWVYSRIDLNNHIGCYNGEFDVTSSGWFSWSRPGSSYLQGTVLFAQLMRPDRTWGPRTSIDLNLFLENNNGTLEFQKLSDSITTSASCFNLSNTILQGLCLGYDGKLHYSEINLDNHYGNVEGRIQSGSSHLFKAGDGFQLRPSASELRLHGHLRCNPRWRPKSRRSAGQVLWNRHDIDLASSIRNRDGQFGFVNRSVAPGSRKYPSPVTPLEDTLRMEYLSREVELASGNKEQIARAIAACTSSSVAAIGILVGKAIGAVIGSSMIGFAIGTGLSAPGGISPEVESLVACISDPLILARSLEAAIGRYIYRALRNVLSPDATEYLVAFSNAKLESNIDEATNLVLDCLGAKLWMHCAKRRFPNGPSLILLCN